MKKTEIMFPVIKTELLVIYLELANFCLAYYVLLQKLQLNLYI